METNYQSPIIITPTHSVSPLPTFVKARLHGASLPKTLKRHAIWVGVVLLILIVGVMVGLIVGLMPFYKENEDTSTFAIPVKNASLIANATLRSLIVTQIANRQQLTSIEQGQLQTLNANITDQLNSILLPALGANIVKIADLLLLPDPNSLDRVSLNYNLITKDVKTVDAIEVRHELKNKVNQNDIISKNVVNPLNGRNDLISGSILIGSIF